MEFGLKSHTWYGFGGLHSINGTLPAPSGLEVAQRGIWSSGQWPGRAQKHKDPTCWFKGPRQGRGCQNLGFGGSGSVCLCGLLALPVGVQRLLLRSLN